MAQGNRAALAAAVQRAWSEQRAVAIAAPEEAAQLDQALPQRSDPGWGAAV
ncbi:MAG: o-succinylbenzoate--CoA ligase, partial [Cyanobacteria bacterium K_DeepCast_35m_m1_288]|nr:o-succinylbenzoate--CoA ligase [Cyanobacteria bacterium K_DeepCast_35m_m1_288]